MALTLVIGNKNYSSWSLRPWLLLTVFEIEFDEILIPLFSDNFKQKLLSYSPAGQVPVIKDDDLSIWDSLAIFEYINETYPEKGCWPVDKQDRAIARSVSAQMHSGFFALRNTLPMNCRKSMKFTKISSELQADIDSICAIWQRCLDTSPEKGPFLFGQFCIADAMFAPVVLRFNSYGIEVGDIQQRYMDAMLALPAMQKWITQGKAESQIIEQAEI
jgi:glutathione S-transferase